ncbi:PREDICTED: lysozyme c-1-like [Dinoponera quadriceps]|uniref:lysozyme n=1 Tax=Dinoponera quadriceps TaxID=609295 RepID=A0A6P3X7Q3_DINQU|nr:PREDICTED: lysozyme c-1-like [Dinoponera quadriceps]XP_014474328.1 PREDICTED: lysozyme c-1-like [Dinoponera quadriceps]
MGRPWAILLLAIVAISRPPVEGKILSQCDAVRELQRAKISRSMMSNWICLMQSESGLDTSRMTGPKTASSYSFGILQINSLKWCTRGRVGGLCNARCEDFMNDDIQDDIACAKKIYNRDGFKAWDGWTKKCKNKPLPNIGNCRRRRRMADIVVAPTGSVPYSGRKSI